MRGRDFIVLPLVALALATPAVAADATHTLDDIAKHGTSADCWTTVRGSVYNLTAWIAQHPHGAEDIIGMCGKDATADFEAEHIGSATAKDALAPFRIGYLPGAAPAPSPTASPTVTATPSAAKPAPTKIRTITCVKGKQIKKLKAAKCPAGWKKR